eukprot:m.51924 g.51924  ORF g.51924 m.51924 type:complete len:156 (+) comp7341_c0_seq2:70-537(+)
MGVHAYAMAWASMLLIGAILILVGGLEYPIVVGSPTNAALGFSGNTQVEVYLNKQCIGSSCDTETSESHFIVAAYTLLVFGAVGALIMSIIIFVMAIMYPHSTDLSKRLAGWDFKLTLLAMVFQPQPSLYSGSYVAFLHFFHSMWSVRCKIMTGA